MLKYGVLATVLMIAPAAAQRLQPGEVRLTMGAWKGTVEVDAFTKKEKIIITNERRGTGLVMRCMSDGLSIGWFAGVFADKYTVGDEGELRLRIGEDIVGPFELTALNDLFAVGPLKVDQLDRIAKAKTEIGYKIEMKGISATGGLGAARTAEVAARLKRSCAGESTLPSTVKEEIKPKGDGKIEEKVH